MVLGARPSKGCVMDHEASAQDRVLAAAEELFYGRGIQAVGMDEIRTAAGVSLKRLYQLYPSKGQLVAAVLAKRDQRWEEGLHRYVDAADSPTDKILAVFDWLSEWFHEPDFRGCTFINTFGEMGATSETVADAARHNKSTFQQTVAGLVNDAQLPPELGDYVALLTEGAITTSAIAGSPEPARTAKAAAKLLLASVATRS